MSVSAAHFESLFSQSDDPWKFRSRWYEERKRALTMSCLPQPRFGSAFEPGCANGELTALLAQRCDRLLATDGSATAVDIARTRVAQSGRAGAIEVRQAWLPDEWPDERFDLIVVSELAYYLDPDALDRVVDEARSSLNAGGTFVACHWRPPIEGCAIDGDEVHDAIGARIGLAHLMTLRDADMRLDVWCADARSIAQREHLRDPGQSRGIASARRLPRRASDTAGDRNCG